jgi:hypothetical protein
MQDRTQWRAPAPISSASSSRAAAGPGWRAVPDDGSCAVKKTCTERMISAGSRPTAAQWSSRMAFLRRKSAAVNVGLDQMSACSATILRPCRSPPDPIMIGGCGRWTGFGSQTAPLS